MRSLPLWVLALCAACPRPEPVCGDGNRDDGEDEVTCCADVGCAVGACTARGCVQPWEEECASAGAQSCMEQRPFRCDGDAPPAYDCAACGCPNGGACVSGACLTAAVRDRVRTGPVASDLDLDIYPAIFVELAGRPQLTLQDLQRSIAQRQREDLRRGAYVGGASSAAGAAAIAAALDAVAPVTSSSSDPCSAAQMAERPLLASVAIAHVHNDTCFFPGTFGDCDPPHAADCALLHRRLPDALIALDADAVLPEMDFALLRRAGRAPPETRGALLQQAVAAFRSGADAFADSPGFAVELADGTRQLRAVVSPRDEDVVYLVLPRRNVKAYRLQAFAALWDNAPARAFMVEHDIQTEDCVINVEERELVTLRCENAGAVIEATVDGSIFRVISVTTVP